MLPHLRVDAHGCSDDYDAVTDIDNVPWPDTNSEEEPCPSNKPICGVKEETNIPHEQRSPIVCRKNEHTKMKPFTSRTLPHQNTYSEGEYEYPYMERNHEPQEDVQQSQRHRLRLYSKHVDEDEGDDPNYHTQERFEYPYMQRHHEP